jgi:hypothetical protein
MRGPGPAGLSQAAPSRCEVCRRLAVRARSARRLHCPLRSTPGTAACAAPLPVPTRRAVCGAACASRRRSTPATPPSATAIPGQAWSPLQVPGRAGLGRQPRGADAARRRPDVALVAEADCRAAHAAGAPAPGRRGFNQALSWRAAGAGQDRDQAAAALRRHGRAGRARPGGAAGQRPGRLRDRAAAARRRCAGKAVLLVDDVMTSGASLHARRR